MKNLLETLSRWSPLGFIIGGLGMLISFILLSLSNTGSANIPEIVVSLIALPSMLVVFLVALLGFYRHVSEASSKLALGGVIAAGLGGLVLLVTTVGAIILELTTETGFTQAEENPLLLVMFFLMLGTYFLSFLLYGIASVRTGEPSTLVGILMLVTVIEPGSAIFFDLFSIEVGPAGPLITLAIGAAAMIAVGFVLNNEPGVEHRTETSQMEPHQSPAG